MSAKHANTPIASKFSLTMHYRGALGRPIVGLEHGRTFGSPIELQAAHRPDRGARLMFNKLQLPLCPATVRATPTTCPCSPLLLPIAHRQIAPSL